MFDITFVPLKYAGQAEVWSAVLLYQNFACKREMRSDEARGFTTTRFRKGFETATTKL